MSFRDTHHHGNLKEALIEWALAEACEGRLDRASLREAARVLGVSPGAVYRHFDDRRALLQTVTERGFDALARAFHEAMPLAAPPADAAAAVARFAALGAAYLAFARRNYELWRLMFGPTAVRVAAPQARPNAFLWLQHALADLAAHGVIAQTGPEAELFAWSTIHGLCELSVSPAVGLPLPGDAVEALCRRIILGLAGRDAPKEPTG
jgi:AcrR family transcriptional regulator